MSVPTDKSQKKYFEAEHSFHRRWNHFVVQKFASQRWDLLENVISMGEIETALDAGAGAGFSTAYAPFNKVWAGDRSIYMLDQHYELLLSVTLHQQVFQRLLLLHKPDHQ